MSTAPEMKHEPSPRTGLMAASSLRRWIWLTAAFGLTLTWIGTPLTRVRGWTHWLGILGTTPVTAALLYWRKKAEPTNMLLLDGALMLLGLIIGETRILAALALHGLLIAGVAMCRMVGVMTDVTRLVSGNASPMPRNSLLISTAAGIAAGVLLVLVQLPVAVIGILGWIASLLLIFCTLRMPVDNRYTHKLQRYLTVCPDNEALRKRLEWVFVGKHSRPWLVLFLEWLLRPLYFYRRKDEQEIREDEDNPLIYLCNHGDIYGPVSCVLHIPSYVRPWSISYMMADQQEAAEYLHRYNFGDTCHWLPKGVKWPVSHMIARLSIWAMNDLLECVPVYRDKPRQLMNTFRISSEVLTSGDQLLIFPENPNAICKDHGYEHEGVGELFAGFAMLAPIYYNRTGKCARFMPMYAHQKARTLSFGHEIVYDPSNDPTDERNRLVKAIDSEMHRLYDREEALYRARKK